MSCDKSPARASGSNPPPAMLDKEFNDGFDDEGLFIGHEEVAERRLTDKFNTFVRACQILIKAGDAMSAKLGDCEEAAAWKELRKINRLPGE